MDISAIYGRSVVDFCVELFWRRLQAEFSLHIPAEKYVLTSADAVFYPVQNLHFWGI